MQLSEILNLLLGSGLVATIVALLTLKSTMRKAAAEAERSVADAETVSINNAENATRILVENIVNPLKNELNETRKYLDAAKREMARLRKAIDSANSCKHHDNCPVLSGLHNQQKDDERANNIPLDSKATGQHTGNQIAPDNRVPRLDGDNQRNRYGANGTDNRQRRADYSNKNLQPPKQKNGFQTQHRKQTDNQNDNFINATAETNTDYNQIDATEQDSDEDLDPHHGGTGHNGAVYRGNNI